MWSIEREKSIIEDNKGTFTVEAVFIMLIIISVVITLLYVSLYCLDRINVESMFREKIRKEQVQGSLKGMLGGGEMKKEVEPSFLYSSYSLNYEIPVRFPFTEDYVEDNFQNFRVKVNVCEKEACDFVRMYDALRSGGE